jgi:hypothetical protein
LRWLWFLYKGENTNANVVEVINNIRIMRLLFAFA